MLKSKKYLFDLFENVHQAVIICNDDFTIFYRNGFYDNFTSKYYLEEVNLFTYIEENKTQILNKAIQSNVFKVKDYWALNKQIKAEFKSIEYHDQVYIVCYLSVNENHSHSLYDKNNLSFTLLSEFSPFTVYVCLNDEHFTMLYLNDKISELTGYDKNEFLSNKINFTEIYHHDDVKFIFDEVQNALNRKTSFELKYRIIHKNGSIKWVIERGAGVFNGNQLLYIEGYIEDVTEKEMLKLQSSIKDEYYYQVFNNNYIMMIVMNPETTEIIDTNNAFSNFYGYSKEELIGQSLEIVHTKNKNDIQVDLNELFSESKFIIKKAKHKKKNRELVDVEIYSSLIFPNGEKKIFSIIRDISYDLSAQAAIENERNQLLAALNATQNGIWLINLNTNTKFANQRFFDIIGYDYDIKLIEPEHRITLVHPDDKEKYLDYIDNSIIYKRFGELEYRIRHKKGHYVWVSSRGVIIFDKQGKPEIITGVISDITKLKNEEISAKNNALLFSQKNHELKLTNQELSIAKNKAEESDRLKTNFLALLSHELRTPLNAINGFSSLMAFEDEIDDLHEFAKIINSSGEKLLEIINDLLDISHIEFDDIKLNIDKVPLGNIYDDIKAYLQVLEREFNISTNKYISIIDNFNYDHREKSINTDRIKLLKIIKNLLNNAVKFTSKGSVEFGCISTDIKFGFYVKDTGIGIAQDQLNQIFESFKQCEGYSTRHFGGLGIGLSIAQNYAQLLNGEIIIETEILKGTVAKILFGKTIISDIS